MRFAALLHDAAKPQTRGMRPDGRVTFIGHDARRRRPGARRAAAAAHAPSGCATTSPASPATTSTSASSSTSGRCTRRTAWRYLRATAPYAADVTVFTVADRIATRGRNAEPAIAAHLELAREMLALAFAERAAGPQAPLVPGDELAARARASRPGRGSASCSRALEEDRYAGEVTTREEAIERARELAG